MMYIYIYIYIHTCGKPILQTNIGTNPYGQFSKVQCGKWGPAPGISKLSKGILKRT